MATKKLAPQPMALPKESPEQQRARELAHAQYLVKATRMAIAAKKSATDLLTFTKFMLRDPEDIDNVELTRYQVKRHHEIIADHLMKVERGETLRLAISVPPQFGKSELTSRNFPAWYVGRNAGNHLMFGTYNQDFSEKFGSEVRERIMSPYYRQVFPKINLRTDSKSRSRMTVDHYGGSLLFIGRGGTGTGNPASLFLIDDPIKDAKEAQSATIRDDVWDWYTHVVESRCNVFSAQVIIQTRWNEDDLIGRLTDPRNPHYNERVAKMWTVVNLPAYIVTQQESDITGVEIGEPLWPERFPMNTLEIKRALDPIAFSALYMGRPTPPEGAFFKATEIYEYTPDMLPKNHRPYMTGDLALGTKKTNDHTCVGKWLLDEHDNLFLHPDLYWDRKAADDSVEKIIDMMLEHEPMDTWWEKGQIDKAVGPFFMKRAAERKCYRAITALPVSGDKGYRASAIRGRMRMGKVFFPRYAKWWPAAKEQLLKFTGDGDDMADDFVDMCSLIGQALGEQVKAGTRIGTDGQVVKSNVVPITGTMAWIRYAADAERAEQKRLEARKGF